MTCNHWSEILCKHWKELDDDVSSCFEYCKALHSRVACCGAYGQCADIRYFNASSAQVVALLKEDRIDSGISRLGLEVKK